MATEVELKAHVRDSEALKKSLSGKADFKCAFEKRDVYWFRPEESDLRVAKIRVRQEKLSFADGTEKSRCLVTYKAKEENNGIEVNEELEFEVEPAEAFEEFLKTAGLKPGAGKIKRGWGFLKDKITAELVEVESLGWFVELEILVSATSKNEKTIKKAKETLLAFLDSLGIERQAIEGRFYLDMLSAADQGTYDI
jgi:adenylate cyclase class 2